MKLPSPPLPKFLRPAPPRPGNGNGRTGRNGRNGGTTAPPAEKPTVKDAAVEGTASAIGWVEERAGLAPFLRGFLYRKVPKGTNWFYTLGSATMFAFLSQAVTGVVLAMYYEPDPTRAYESASRITNEVFLGEFVRGMHKWGSTVMIILIFLHMGRTFVFGAYTDHGAPARLVSPRQYGYISTKHLCRIEVPNGAAPVRRATHAPPRSARVMQRVA